MKIILTLVLLCTSLFSENTSLRFTEGNYARLPVITEIQNAEEVTMEVWYYEESASGEENIIGNEWFGGNFEFYRDSDGTIDWGENNIQASPQGSGHWMHIAGTYSAVQGRKLFIDGVLVDSCNDCPLEGGQYSGSESMYDGIWLGTHDELTINRHTWGG